MSGAFLCVVKETGRKARTALIKRRVSTQYNEEETGEMNK